MPLSVPQDIVDEEIGLGRAAVIFTWAAISFFDVLRARGNVYNRISLTLHINSLSYLVSFSHRMAYFK